MLVAEAEAVKAAEIVRSAKRPLVIERDLRALVRFGHRRHRAQREHSAGSSAAIRLHIGFSALKWYAFESRSSNRW